MGFCRFVVSVSAGATTFGAPCGAPQTIKLVVSLVIVDVLVVERIQETELSVSEAGKSESVEARTEAARTALPIVRDFLIAGSGGGSFYNIFLGYRTPSYGYTFVDHTHNDFVEIASDYGILGLGMLGSLVVVIPATWMKVLSKILAMGLFASVMPPSVEPKKQRVRV